MKKTLPIRSSVAMILSIAFTFTAFSQTVTVPRNPSPGSTVSQTIGISTVTVNYSRPSVKGREIWGVLVPYGLTVQAANREPAPWRAGANENTVITFSHAAKVEGKDVPAGSYGLFFTINSDDTGEVILSKDYRSWGAFHYDSKQDQARASIKVRPHEMTELLTYDFINLTKNSGELVLNWEKKQFPVKIEFATDDLVLANATEELKSVQGFTWMGWNSAANYALLNNGDTAQAMKWVNQSITMNKNFTNLMTKAGLLRKENKVDEATKIETEALTSATEAELNAYGYQLINQGKMEEAIKVMETMCRRYPNSANAFDSLGEAYALKGDKENAIKNFKKSLSMNPPEATRLNSEKYLKQLGAM